MKILVFVLAIVASLFGLLYLQSVQQKPVTGSSASLVVTQLVERPAITTEVERAVTVLVTNTTELEAKLTGLESKLAQTSESLQAEEAKSDSLDRERMRLLIQLGAVSNELTHVQRQFSQLKAQNEATEEELRAVQNQKSALQAQKVTLEKEKEGLERRLHNLDDLRAQIRLVKKQLWVKKVEEWKQTDKADAVGGNRGYLMLRGQWTGSPTNQPPQN
jgi:chromosome segregation ATPase